MDPIEIKTSQEKCRKETTARVSDFERLYLIYDTIFSTTDAKSATKKKTQNNFKIKLKPLRYSDCFPLIMLVDRCGAPLMSQI